jgi:hypothetical protein
MLLLIAEQKCIPTVEARTMCMFDYFQKATTNQPLFPKVTEINLTFNHDWPLFPLPSLATFIDISRIVNMKIYSSYFNEYIQNTWMDIGIFIEQAHNLSSLIIQSGYIRYQSDRMIENIYSIVPRHVTHLQMPINNVDQIKTLLERCQHLSTIHLDLRYSIVSGEVIKWFADNTVNSTCSKGYKMVVVWLGKKNIESSEINDDHKRIKLNDNYSDS